MGKELFVCIVVIGFLVILIISRNLKLNYEDLPNNHRFLHVNIELDSKILPLEKNIFFHETTFFNRRHIRLNSRQACAVESAARWNSEMDVYLIFVSSGRILDSSMELFKQLLTYPNVKIRYIELGKYMADTPLEDWYKRDALKTSLWPISHLSDALRFLSLWKYGGIYLDMDVVVMKPFANLSSDFAAAESDSVIGSAVLAFSKSDVGRRVAVECVKEVNSNFQGDIWGHNGPGVITRILKQLCLTENIDAMISEPCDGFTVYPPSKFFPIPYQNWMEYFDEENTNRTMAKLENATLIHVWNKLTASQNVSIRGDSPYPIIVRENCPRITKVSGEYF